MMSENKNLRNRSNKAEAKPSGNSSRNDAHEVKYDKIIVLYVGIVKTFLFKFFKFRASIL